MHNQKYTLGGKQIKTGDFSKLANNYKKYRPSYNKHIVKAIVNATNKKPGTINAADIGAGTGIFTKCLIDAGIKRVLAVEPNENMRSAGTDFLGTRVNFLDGCAENTTLEDGKFDLITMASSFHWTDNKRALTEFDRILKPNGVFAAVWNPRLTKRSMIESRVQNLLENKYQITTRISSGLSYKNWGTLKNHSPAAPAGRRKLDK